MALVTALTQIQTVLGALSGVRSAPATPPEAINATPIILVYPAFGRFTWDTPEGKRGLHNVGIDVLTEATDIARARTLLNPFVESIPNALFKGVRDNAFTAFSAFGQIEYEFVSVKYAEIDYLGYRFVVTDLKIRDTIT